MHTAPTIKVIIRKGRLKNSGVRGEKFSRYAFILEDGTRRVFRAICYDNAEKRLRKEYPNMKFELEEIFN